VAEAWALYKANDMNRWHVEARLVTDQPVEEVAARCSLLSSTVDAYEKLFFDVRSRPAAGDWLAHRVLPPRWAVLGIHPGDTATLLKLAALKGGPLALDQALRTLTRRGCNKGRDQLDLYGLAEASVDLACRLSLLLETLPLSAFRPPFLNALQMLAQAVSDLQFAVESACWPGPMDAVRDELRGALLGRSCAPGGAAPDVLPGLAARLAQLEVVIDQLTTFSFAVAA
jgi:hypothetical protein